MKTNAVIEVEIPATEILAAFRVGYRTAVREGFSRKAEEIRTYIEALEQIDSLPDYKYGTWKIAVVKR